MSGCVHIFVALSTHKSPFQVIMLVVFDGMSPLFGPSEIAQSCMRVFNAAASWPCPPPPFKGNRDVY